MLFDVERARSIVEEYEQRVSVYKRQRALYGTQELQGLHLADTLVMTLWHWHQSVAHSMRWLLTTHDNG